MAEHNDLGKWGEAEASRYLESKGYAILDRDWRFGKRDLDIVALSEGACTMVAANAYVKGHAVAQELRFDIISIVGSPSKIERIDHLVDAFNPLLVL